METLIRKNPLRDQVYERLRREILRGTRRPLDRLRDVALAQALGVSRTPVREAMLRLAEEGFLQADHNRGFRVAALDPVEVREIYPIIAALEAAGLRSAGSRTRPRLDKLRSLNARLGAAKSSAARLRIDMEWHAALVAPSENGRLLATLALHKNVVRRYENRYMDSVVRVLGSVGEHDSIIGALEEEDIDLACRRLEEHWRRGMEGIIELMKK